MCYPYLGMYIFREGVLRILLALVSFQCLLDALYGRPYSRRYLAKFLFSSNNVPYCLGSYLVRRFFHAKAASPSGRFSDLAVSTRLKLMCSSMLYNRQQYAASKFVGV